MSTPTPDTSKENQTPKENETTKNTKPSELKEEKLDQVNGGIMFVSEKFKQTHGIS